MNVNEADVNEVHALGMLSWAQHSPPVLVLQILRALGETVNATESSNRQWCGMRSGMVKSRSRKTAPMSDRWQNASGRLELFNLRCYTALVKADLLCAPLTPTAT